MHDTVNKIISIEKEIQQKIIEKKLTNYKPTIVAISKTFSIDKILPLINYGHNHFGENKVQEALEKWNQKFIDEFCKVEFLCYGGEPHWLGWLLLWGAVFLGVRLFINWLRSVYHSPREK